MTTSNPGRGNLPQGVDISVRVTCNKPQVDMRMRAAAGYCHVHSAQ